MISIKEDPPSPNDLILYPEIFLSHYHLIYSHKSREKAQAKENKLEITTLIVLA